MKNKHGEELINTKSKEINNATLEVDICSFLHKLFMALNVGGAAWSHSLK